MLLVGLWLLVPSPDTVYTYLVYNLACEQGTMIKQTYFSMGEANLGNPMCVCVCVRVCVCICVCRCCGWHCRTPLQEGGRGGEKGGGLLAVLQQPPYLNVTSDGENVARTSCMRERARHTIERNPDLKYGADRRDPVNFGLLKNNGFDMP